MGLIGRSNLPINSKHCRRTCAKGRIVSLLIPCWRCQRNTTYAHWWHSGCRWQTTRIGVAQSMSPEVLHSWSFSLETTHRPLAPCRFFPSGRTWSIRGTHRPNDSSFANKNQWWAEPSALAKSKYTTSAMIPSSINRVTVSYSIRRLKRHKRWSVKPCRQPVIVLHSLRNEKLSLFNICSKTLHTTEVR